MVQLKGGQSGNHLRVLPISIPHGTIKRKTSKALGLAIK